MQDILSRIAVSGTTPNTGFIDIALSSGHANNITAPVTIGRVGLSEGLHFIVHITDGTAQAVTPVSWVLQLSTDGGTSWRDIAIVTANVVSSKAILSTPVGLIDHRPENFAEGNIRVRIRTTHTTVASSDNISYDAYLGHMMSLFRPFN